MKHKFGPALLSACLSICVMAACQTQTTGIQQPVRRVVSAEETFEGIEVAVAGENLLLKKGVRVTADSQESDGFKAVYAADGITDDDELRWSSENDWEDSDHWLQVKFGQETRIGFVKIFWERTNACAYTLEYSLDGKDWSIAAAFDDISDHKEQNICLEEPVTAKYLRVHVTDVTKEEADLSLYYQNVSILELEVYGPLQDRFVISRPQIDSGYDRKLVLPEVPEGYELAFGGADYENLITEDGQIADTLSAVTVESGFILKKEGECWELPGIPVEIPASQPAQEKAAEQKPPVSVQEWCAEGKWWSYPETLLVTVEDANQEFLTDTVAVFLQELADTVLFSEVLPQDTNVTVPAEKTFLNGRIHLSLLDDIPNSLGEEGYEICVDETQILIRANTVQGIRWGCVTLLEWLRLEGHAAALTTGIVRDYPAYPVRGFGIDVGRRAISLDLLYRIVEELSARKMNTLLIHLNDNQIIAQSEYDGTVAGARSLYAGFRLESEIKNKSGAGITSGDLYYTKEAFEELIATAAAYGVEIVPEIDTPAHSLALTRVFPEYGFSKDPESVDQLDLSKDGARQLVKDIWSEYLTADSSKDSVFENCTALHLGMDEYYGKDSAYIAYLQELSSFVEQLAPEKELRIWGSLSRMDADYSGISRSLQMHVWDTDWADPGDMYKEGFPIINSLSSRLYIIPGGGYDTLDTEFLEAEWQPNLFQTAERDWELPAWSDRMLGACYMMWNDWSWANGDEITEDSLFERFEEPLPILARKLWGEHR